MKYFLVPSGSWTLSSLVRSIYSFPIGSLFPCFCQDSGRTSCTHGHHSNIYLFIDPPNTYLVPIIGRLGGEGTFYLELWGLIPSEWQWVQRLGHSFKTKIAEYLRQSSKNFNFNFSIGWPLFEMSKGTIDYCKISLNLCVHQELTVEWKKASHMCIVSKVCTYACDSYKFTLKWLNL